MNKRNLFFLAILMVLVNLTQAENVPVQTAQQAAQSFLNSKMEGNPQIHLIDFAEKAEFPNFYVFGNERCFVIIAADDCVQPIIGYSTEGGFGEEAMPIVIMDWMKVYNDGIAFAKESRLEATMEICNEWDNLLSGRGLEPKSRSFVKPLIRTKWSQSAPFNNLCPLDTANHSTGHAVAGCGAIAMAQIMNYWEHPVRGIGSHSYTPASHPEYGQLSANFGETTYDWDNMKNIYSRGYSDAEAMAVATLVYHCGVSVNMNYGPNASGVNSPILDDALRTYFDYSSSTDYLYKSAYSDSQWITMLKNELDLERPVLYRGANPDNNSAHLFVCDGYDENGYFHFNWGGAGNYDGYYAIGSLNYGSEANWSYHNAAVFNCFPNSTSIAPPVNVDAMVTNRNVVINWSAVSDASYYKLYCDGDLIANDLQTTSYVDVNVYFGTHSYYVKSVNLGGTMSLKSNTAVADVHFPGPKPTDLQASVNSQNVNLSWQTLNAETAVLQYGTGDYYSHNGYNDGTYWGQRYPASTICEYAGMAIEKVSAYFLYSGNYTLFVFKGDEINTNELVYQQGFEATAESWQDIVFPNPVAIDYTQDLWVVLYSNINKPAPVCVYTLTDKENAALFSNTGVRWTPITNRSCMMKTYITDGTYTYNLYRNGDAIATDLSGNTYTDSDLSDGIYNYHVTTNYFGGESDPSNTVNVQIGEAGVQTAVFASGWNWWSSYVELGSNSLSLLEDGLGTNGVAIKSQDDGYASYLDGFGWYGSLNGLNNESSYQVRTNEACEVEMTGGLVNPAMHPVTLHPGWTWIGYPVNVTMGVDEALSGIVPQTGDMLKSQNDGYASYLAGYGWYGSLNTLTPGMGLMYRSNNSSSVTLTYPNGGSKEELKANQTSETNHWRPNLNAYPDNMSVMAVVELDGEELQGEHYELAAFVDNVCRGSARLMYVEPIDRYMAFLTVAGDEATELRFSLYDTETGEEYHNANGTLAYEANAVVGSFENPFVLDFHGTTGIDDGDSLVRVYPNPANDILTIQGEGLRSIAVFNALGQKIEAVEVKGQEEIRIRLMDYESGIYILSIRTENGQTIKRFVKRL